METNEKQTWIPPECIVIQIQSTQGGASMDAESNGGSFDS